MSESEKFVRSFNHVRRLRTSTNNKTHATVAAAAAAAAHCSLLTTRRLLYWIRARAVLHID